VGAVDVAMVEAEGFAADGGGLAAVAIGLDVTAESDVDLVGHDGAPLRVKRERPHQFGAAFSYFCLQVNCNELGKTQMYFGGKFYLVRMVEDGRDLHRLGGLTTIWGEGKSTTQGLKPPSDGVRGGVLYAPEDKGPGLKPFNCVDRYRALKRAATPKELC